MSLRPNTSGSNRPVTAPLSERALIARIARATTVRHGVALGIGDDAAVIDGDPVTVVTQDLLVVLDRQLTAKVVVPFVLETMETRLGIFLSGGIPRLASATNTQERLSESVVNRAL